MEKKTADAVEILHRRYINGDKKREAELEEERLHARVARQIYDLRCGAGLSQKELAEKLGTTQSVISRLEDADYEAPAELVAQLMLKGHIDRILASLGEREQAVVRLRYGLDDGETRTLEEVGRQFGVTRERVRQIEAKTLAKLRRGQFAAALRDYLR